MHIFLWSVSLKIEGIGTHKSVIVFRPSVRCRENGNNFATNNDFRSDDDGSTTWSVYYGDPDALGGWHCK